MLPWLSIAGVAAILTLPAAIGSMRLNDSFWIDWVWLDQFARELGHGVTYPRWLPLSHGGMGSPVFYYYPPVAFYAGSLFVLAGLSTYASLIALFFAAYVLSGATMYAFLKDEAPHPLLGALVYVAAPYHAFNFYIRGAISEFLATAILPLVMLGLRKLSRDERGGFVLTALSYGVLIATHLPLAFLASLFLFGPYALWLVRARWSGLLPMAAALATGIALACVYLVPALLLEPYRDSGKLWADPTLHPQNWSLWDPQFWQAHSYIGVLLIAIAIAIPLIVLAIWRRSGWAIWGLACTVLAVGVLPALWALPLLSWVQFPFRLLPIAEFALATSIALVAPRGVLLALISLPFLFVTAQIVRSQPGSEGVTLADLQTLHPDVPENLPPGERPYSWPSRWALGVASSYRQPQFAEGVTVEPVFYFPAWHVKCAGQPAPTFPDPKTQLLSYKGQGCTRALGLTAPEKIGAAISLLGLFVLLLLSAFGWTGRLRGRSLARKRQGGEVPEDSTIRRRPAR